MRVLKAALAVAVILGLAGAAAAQSLGQLADQEKQKRQGKPAPKTLTEADLAKAGKRGTLSMSGSPEVPSVAASETPAEATAAVADGSVPEAVPEGSTEAPPEAAPLVPEKAPEPVRPKGPPPKSEEETRAEAKANLQKQLDAARTNLATHQNLLAQIEGVLNASASDYSQGRALLFKRQDEEKAAVAKFQDEVAKLEEEIRRSAWPR